MSAPAFTITEAPPWDADVEAWLDRTCEAFYAESQGAPSGDTPHRLRALDGAHAPIGACEAHSWFGGTYISRLVVSKDWRGRGVGRALLERAVALGRACAPHATQVSYLCTLDYQAPQYYPRLGFRVDHKIEKWGPSERVVTYFSRPVTDRSPPPPPIGFEIEVNVPTSDTHFDEFLRATFQQHSAEATGADSKFFAISLEAKSVEFPDIRVGALTAISYWGGLVISLFAVSKEWRSRGVGSALLERALALGREKGCTVAVVETMSFQAPSFYVKLGFSKVGLVEGFARGAQLIRLCRRL